MIKYFSTTNINIGKYIFGSINNWNKELYLKSLGDEKSDDIMSNFLFTSR